MKIIHVCPRLSGKVHCCNNGSEFDSQQWTIMEMDPNVDWYIQYRFVNNNEINYTEMKTNLIDQ